MENKNKTVFVIEDDPDLVELMSYNLDREGFRVVQAHSGLQAIWETVKRNRPDCILLDLMMPSPNGYEVCDYIKSSEDYRDIPVIIVSARGDPQDIEKAMDLGADVFLKKPFKMASLLEIVKKYSTPRGVIRFPPE
ncbi:MAG: response regulator [bacterium]